MAKIAFSKLGLTKDKLDEFQTVEFNDQTVEVKQYLPIAEKAELISRVLNNSVDDDAGYYNNLKLDMWLALEIVYAYSNINFTEKQKSDPMKLYDLLSSNKLLNLIIGLVPESEFYYLTKVTHELATAIYTYRNSALGILDSIGRDYSNLNFDATEIQKKLADPENLTFLQNIVEKLG